MTDEKTLQEIAIQDSVSLDYDTIRYYRPFSENYQDEWFKKMVQLINKKGVILDNGCGVGQLSKFFPAEDIVGYDISQGMLDKAKNKLQYLIQGDSQLLPFRDEVFDIVVCRSLLHHLPNPHTALLEMNRVLKPHGELVLTEPIDTILSRFPRKLVKKSGHFSELHRDFKSHELIELIELKFTVAKIEYFGYLAYPIMGFPDIVDPFKYVPFKKPMSSFLIFLDNICSSIPVIKKTSWVIIIKAIKK
jgi:ubiquinone/menaquinone biosynthesis C-methylase UbiE